MFLERIGNVRSGNSITPGHRHKKDTLFYCQKECLSYMLGVNVFTMNVFTHILFAASTSDCDTVNGALFELHWPLFIIALGV